MKWQFGNISVYRVLEFEGPLLSPSFLYPTSTRRDIERHYTWLKPALLDSSGLLNLAFHAFVVRTPQTIILVDACSGNNKLRPQKLRYHMNNWPFLENLAAFGIKREDVDLIVFTHLHVDHVGWNTVLSGGRWIPTFPNAKYLFVRQEWEYWDRQYKTPEFTDDPYYKDSIFPLFDSGQVLLVDPDYSIADGVCLEHTPGHTPGHVCVHISSEGQEAVMSGDIMHHPIQCAEPDLSSCFCVDPEQAQRTRYAFLDRYAGTPILVMPAHFPTPSVGFIHNAGGTWGFSFQKDSH